MYKNVNYTAQQLEEIRVAGQLHDVGKIITPDHILCKATKLETILDGVEAVSLRFEILKRDREITRLLRTRFGGSSTRSTRTGIFYPNLTPKPNPSAEINR